eukprot:3751288-Heterocapsa_arctica.AAC.1
MQHDADKDELTSFKNRTRDRAEWGAYKQIILWSSIYQIKIGIHCCSMNMQTIDGDEFILDK